jgi:5-oxoprolinase (ATP-hydrolysing) subunit C
MTQGLHVMAAGLANTVQDAGRLGFSAIGVPMGGAADPWLMACANHLVGNPQDAAVVEMPAAGPSLRVVGEPVRLALAGSVTAQLRRADGQTVTVDSWMSVTLRAGDTLQVGAVKAGVAYLAVSGGCLVPLQLGSRSTYARAGLGGVAGRALQTGDHIACGALVGDAMTACRAPPWVHDTGPIRVMLGPQEDAFTDASMQTFLSEPFSVSRDSDRMGMRLEGPSLAHVHGADLCSEGVVPGAIQVPGNGAPIILLADAQTVGGYTKIATVIRADLPRLAHLRPGDALRFVAVTRALALSARTAQAAAWPAWAARVQAFSPAGDVDLTRLFDANLVSGIIDAHNDILPWEPLHA